MVDHEIGGAADADIPRILQVRRAAFALHAPLRYSVAEVATLLADVDEAEFAEMIDGRQLFVARRAGRVVGLAGWKGERLRHVYVDPEHLRRGIASTLVGRVESDLRERTGANRIRAGVALHAEPFYRAIGYDVVDRIRAWDGSAYLEMTKAL